MYARKWPYCHSLCSVYSVVWPHIAPSPLQVWCHQFLSTVKWRIRFFPFLRQYIKGKNRNRRSVSALSALSYSCTTTLYFMVDIVKEGWRAPPTLTQDGLIFPSWWNIRQTVAVAILCVLCGLTPHRPCKYDVTSSCQLWKMKDPRFFSFLRQSVQSGAFWCTYWMYSDHAIPELKRGCHEIFCFRFYSSSSHKPVKNNIRISWRYW